MALEIILAILIAVAAILGTIIGTGLGYFLSMRAKRQEWAKEYREKRLRPLIDYINEFMGATDEFDSRINTRNNLEQQLEQIKNDKKRKVVLEMITKVNEEATQANKRLIELLSRKSWGGLFSPIYLDKQLNTLIKRWFDMSSSFINQPTDENFEEQASAAQKLLNRIDELIVGGWKTPIIRR